MTSGSVCRHKHLIIVSFNNWRQKHLISYYSLMIELILIFQFCICQLSCHWYSPRDSSWAVPVQTLTFNDMFGSVPSSVRRLMSDGSDDDGGDYIIRSCVSRSGSARPPVSSRVLFCERENTTTTNARRSFSHSPALFTTLPLSRKFFETNLTLGTVLLLCGAGSPALATRPSLTNSASQ